MIIQQLVNFTELSESCILAPLIQEFFPARYGDTAEYAKNIIIDISN